MGESLTKHKRYTKEILIEEIKRFVNEFNKIPTPKSFEKLKGYPSRKTFTNHFEHFNDAVRLAGYEVESLGTNEKKI